MRLVGSSPELCGEDAVRPQQAEPGQGIRRIPGFPEPGVFCKRTLRLGTKE